MESKRNIISVFPSTKTIWQIHSSFLKVGKKGKITKKTVVNNKFMLRILWRRENVDKGLKRPWCAVLRNIYSNTLKENQNVLLLNNSPFVANKTTRQLRSNLKKANSSISWKPSKIFKGKHHKDQYSFIILKRKRGKGTQVKICLSVLSLVLYPMLAGPRATSQTNPAAPTWLLLSNLLDFRIEDFPGKWWVE